jgi:hypothetical protein
MPARKEAGLTERVDADRHIAGGIVNGRREITKSILHLRFASVSPFPKSRLLWIHATLPMKHGRREYVSNGRPRS